MRLLARFTALLLTAFIVSPVTAPFCSLPLPALLSGHTRQARTGLETHGHGHAVLSTAPAKTADAPMLVEEQIKDEMLLPVFTTGAHAPQLLEHRAIAPHQTAMVHTAVLVLRL